MDKVPDGVATATILSGGSPIDPGYALLSIDIRREVNRIPSARLVLVDGDSAVRRFSISNAEFFAPGKEIEIRLRYEGATQNASVFKGRVMCHGVEADREDSRLWVELKDAAIKLTQVRNGKVFRQQTDAQVIKSIIEAGGLMIGELPPTEPKHPEIVQYYCTDWDFILSRADAYGLLVVVNDGKITLQKIDLQGQPRRSFEYGLSEIYNFEIEANATHQYSELQSVGWDLKAQKITEPRRADAFGLSQSNLDGMSLGKTVGFGAYTLSHPVPVDPQELQAWANGRMVRSRMSMIRGRLAVPGFADIKLLDLIVIAGVGERFNGKTPITGICHRLDAEGWRTDLQFGLSPHGFCRESNIQEAPSAGLIPAVSGIQIGVVGGFKEDPEKQFRVELVLPCIGAEAGPVWARLASPDAGKGRGQFFRPEPGDEVVVGFLNDDPRQPVILGALYSTANAPPTDLSQMTDKNLQKGFVTKKGTTIRFVDDEKASVFIETPQKNKIRFDDGSEGIYISDQHGNTLTMDQNGIKLKSAKDLTIEASGNVEIKGSKVNMK
jgi:Rhs element Vgr protein